MKRFLLVLAAALALPGTASAKEVQSLSVCGLHGCSRIAGTAARDYIVLLQRGGENDVADVATPVPAGPYYRLSFRIGGEGEQSFTITAWYVRPNLTRQDLSAPFRRVPAELAGGLDAAASQLAPFPAPAVRSARVNGRPVPQPAPYGGLFASLPPSSTPVAQGRVRILLVPSRRNPWFDGAVPIRYSPERRVLLLVTPVRVPAALAARIARDAHGTLAASFGWLPLALALPFGGVLLARRRRLALLAAVGAALALPGSALAKQVQSVSVCGTNGCTRIAGAVQPFRAVFEGDGANAPRTILDAVPVSAYYKLGVVVRGDRVPAGKFSLTLWYVRPNLVRQAEGVRDMLSAPFLQIPDSLAARLDEAARNVHAFPPPRVIKAYVDGKVSADPRAYLGLFEKLPSVEATTDSGGAFVNISLVADRPNPWFVDGLSFLYLNDEQALFLAKPLRVDDALAERIARDAHIRSPAHHGAGWAHPVKLGILVGWIPIVVALGLAYTRRRRRPATD